MGGLSFYTESSGFEHLKYWEILSLEVVGNAAFTSLLFCFLGIDMKAGQEMCRAISATLGFQLRTKWQ
jgi:hypothetical protein